MLYELLYSSVATAALKEGGIEELLVRARRTNAQSNITGVLFYNGRKFLQLLEGSKEDVDRLFAVIRDDERHCQVTVFHSGEIAERAFSEWTMAYETVGTDTSLQGWQDQLTTPAREDGGHLSNIGYRLMRLMRDESVKQATGSLAVPS